MFEYIKNFKKLGFGLFIHFGLYSVEGKGEWYKHMYSIPDEQYERLINQFNVKKGWAKRLVNMAKKAGCKYITLTVRHHDGFSLFDTCGLNDYDAPHSKTGRDLIKEFVEACREGEILPMFYHTLLDWREKSYRENFPAYIDYLVESIKILCTNYGKIGGFWFDGMWDKKDEDWQEDRIYGTIRQYQPDAMIINNTGLSALGKVGHPEIDSVTFERGKPTAYVDNSDKPRAGEMCQVVNDHWGYAQNDINYKSVRELIGNLIDCRKYGCNFLLNIGPKGSGDIRAFDKCILEEIGKWIKLNKNFIYEAQACDILLENADVVTDGKYFYAIARDVGMSADPNVGLQNENNWIKSPYKIKSAKWLDNDMPARLDESGYSVFVEPFGYGISYINRVVKLEFYQ